MYLDGNEAESKYQKDIGKSNCDVSSVDWKPERARLEDQENRWVTKISFAEYCTVDSVKLKTKGQILFVFLIAVPFKSMKSY